MIILSPTNFPEYELLDSGDGRRLEKFGKYVLSRPDPQAIWKPKLSPVDRQKVDAIFEDSGKNNLGKSEKRGIWKKNKNVPDNWVMAYQDISFLIKLSPFKHTGVFPEQASQWEWVSDRIKDEQSPSSNPLQLNILNLFGYTGIASLVAAKAGARVTHVDASYPTIGWARENQKLSKLGDKPIRWILDDALKFVQREIKRGVKYDGILMDPPIYGHGPNGEIWDFDKSFPELMTLCKQILSPKLLFFLVNAYAISASSIMLENVLKDYLSDLGGVIESGELVLKEKSGNRLLSTGIFARWSKD